MTNSLNGRAIPVLVVVLSATLAILGWAIIDRMSIGAQLESLKYTAATLSAYRAESEHVHREQDKAIAELSRKLLLIETRQRQVLHKLNIPVDTF